MKQPITTLSELEQKQEQLKMLMEVTKQELASSIGTNRKQIKNFAIKNFAIPTGIIGLGMAASKHFLSNDSKQQNHKNQKSMLIGLLPLGLNILQTYILKDIETKTGDHIFNKK